MSFCQQCGNKVDSSSMFCASCGAGLKEKKPEQSNEQTKPHTSYRIVIEGKCLTGFDVNKVREDFARLMRQSDAVAANLLAGSESTIKKGIDEVAGNHYVNTLRQIGVACRMEEEPPFSDVALPPSTQPKTEVVQAISPAIPPVANAAPEPSISLDEKWYYGIDERQFGPLSTSKMLDFINKRIIGASTLVKTESGDWTTAINSKLSVYIERLASAGPSKDVNNIFAWLLAATPVVGAIVEGMINIRPNEQFLTIVCYFIVNSIFCILDSKKLKSDGYQSPNIAWLILIPVYLWKRSTVLKQNRNQFWAWVISFVFSVIISAIGIVIPVKRESANNDYFHNEIMKPTTSQITNADASRSANQMGTNAASPQPKKLMGDIIDTNPDANPNGPDEFEKN